MLNELNYLREHGFNHFVGAFGNIREDGYAVCLHIVGYPEPTTQADIDSLIDELESDEELGLTHLRYGVDYVLRPVTEDMFEV